MADLQREIDLKRTGQVTSSTDPNVVALKGVDFFLTGTLSGLSMVQGFNNALDSLNTCNSGASAPTNQLSGAPSAGNCWYNTATGALQFYDGTSWLTVG